MTPLPAGTSTPSRGGRRVAILADQFPEPSETFVAAEARALADLGACVRVEAHGRGTRGADEMATGIDVRYMADDGLLSRVSSLAWLLTRAPLAALSDLRDRRRWRAEDHVVPLRALAPVARRIDADAVEHLHAHFAAGAALSAMRIAALLDLPWSVTAHGYDIFSTRRNLREKLSRSTFATTGSDFTVAALREHADPADHAKIHRIVMGVDGDVWTRRTPHPGGGIVLAVGRLVSKKGFADLIDAVALLRDDPAFERLVVIGAGPLHDQLQDRVQAQGVGDRVSLIGSQTSDEIRAALEQAALVAIPCVIAPDGDADSMPVIAKEALAMEVPVVASDAAGLPEVIDESCGRLVRAEDPTDLARGIAEVLRLGPDDRAALGRAGRARVTGEIGLHRQTADLLALIEAAVKRR